MILKKHIGLTYTLIGILIPLFTTVCLVSAAADKPVSFPSNNVADNFLVLQQQDIPGNAMSIKQDVDFIYRVKNYRIFAGNNHFLKADEMNRMDHPESSLSPLLSIPRPAYYNYLFMFKPFE